MRVFVIIVAGGSGSRLGGETPKQYIDIAGKSLLSHTLENFLNHSGIEKIQVVIGKNHENLFKKSTPISAKILPATQGGKTRQESVLNGLIAIKKYKPSYVLIHDAARPFVSRELISKIISSVKKNRGVIPVLSIVDTLKKTGRKLKTIDRENLLRAQTPQGFDFKLILAAHEKFKGKNFTDDAEVFESYGLPVETISGSEKNFKITTQDDLERAKFMLKKSTENKIFRTGFGFDVHAFEKGNSVTICGVKIPHTHKLKGHSDADVGLHAIVDAILGAIGSGDIGEHFPPSEKKWKNADSKIFLQHAKTLLDEKNFVIENIDVTIICEKPKITPHKKIMRKTIAGILNLPEDKINVKATTTEGLGFTGRGEGIAANAVATVAKIA